VYSSYLTEYWRFPVTSPSYNDECMYTVICFSQLVQNLAAPFEYKICHFNISILALASVCRLRMAIFIGPCRLQRQRTTGRRATENRQQMQGIQGPKKSLERRIQGPRVTQQVHVSPTLFLGRAGDKDRLGRAPIPLSTGPAPPPSKLPISDQPRWKPQFGLQIRIRGHSSDTR